MAAVTATAAAAAAAAAAAVAHYPNHTGIRSREPYPCLPS